MGKYDELVERLREHATDWDGRQMPDGEPAKGDPTAGDLRKSATAIATLEAELAAAQQQVKGALVMHDALSEKLENTQAELAAMKARGDRLAEALDEAPVIGRAEHSDHFRLRQDTWLNTTRKVALSEWRDQ